MKRSNSMSVLSAQFHEQVKINNLKVCFLFLNSDILKLFVTQSLISNLMGLRGRTTSTDHIIRPTPTTTAAADS